jgi:SHS2 domain-containing protein
VLLVLMAPDSPDWFHEIDHTGDIGIQVTAASLPQLFERAALGMFRVLTDLGTVHESESTQIAVNGRDLEALMVRWLSELNYRHTVDDLLFKAFEVMSIDETNEDFVLTATARGEPIDPDRHTVYTEIKAITFHGMEIKETDAGWAVQVIFDM